MKKHLWLHFAEQAVEFGQEQRSTNTELGESGVKETVKVWWSKSNKQKRHSERIMLNYGIAKEFAMMLVQVQCPENEMNPFRPRLLAEPEGNEYSECEELEQEGSALVVDVTSSIVCVSKFDNKPLKYKVVVNMGRTDLKSGGYGSICQVDRATKTLFCHPLLTFPELYNLLNFRRRKHDVSPTYSIWWDNFVGKPCSTKVMSSLHFVGGISCEGCEEEEVDPFWLRARTTVTDYRDPGDLNSPRSKQEHAFSFVEVFLRESDSTTSFVKVLAMLACTTCTRGKDCEKTKKSTILKNEMLFLLVAQLEQRVKSKRQKLLPFAKYGFLVRGQDQLQLHLLPLASVYRPAFMVSSDLGDRSIEGIRNIRAASWFCIPFRQCCPTYKLHQPREDREREDEEEGEDEEGEGEEEDNEGEGEEDEDEESEGGGEGEEKEEEEEEEEEEEIEEDEE